MRKLAYSFTLSAEQYDALSAAARRRRTSRSALVQDLIDEQLRTDIDDRDPDGKHQEVAISR